MKNILGNEGDSLTITGTQFSSTSSENTVTIGGTACDVTAATPTSITCTVGNGPERAFPVMVNVVGKGLAANTAPDFEYGADIRTVSPTMASLGGKENSDIHEKYLAKLSKGRIIKIRISEKRKKQTRTLPSGSK